MKLSYYKGCFSRHLSISGDEINLDLSSEEKDEWKQNWDDLKTVLLRLVNKAAEESDGLNQFYRYFVESQYKEIDYQKPVEENPSEVLLRVTNHIQQFDLEQEYFAANVAEYFEDLISHFHVDSEDNNDHTCDQCGDYNYKYKIEI